MTLDHHGRDAGRDDDRDELLEALFHEALSLTEDERAGFVRRHCAGDPELAEELATLLGAHGRARDLLDRPAWGEAPAACETVGDVVGPYHLVRALGEGGMGSVFLAKQLRPLRRTVALKLIKPGMDTAEVVARFDAERQVLAQLNHPGIAAVHDAGITPRGRPYFVMEAVEGEPLTRWCDARKLSLRRRLLLFRTVCEAVQHAHQKGVIHRDLKPGNVLVTEVDGKPAPKIIDFGVAKATHGAGGGGTLCTRRGQIVGTPAYMSPEQAGVIDAPVDTRTDVYALGVMLAELLTGVLPYELGSLRGADDARVRERLAAAEVVRPALRVALLGPRARKAAALRGLEPRSLSRALKGDLDVIVQKALERDPERRYATVSELAADVAAHLDGEPVSARAPGALYRARKLVAKNKGVASAVAGALLLGVAGLAAYAWTEADLADELQAENAELVVAHDAELGAVLEREDALLAACDAARHAAGADLQQATALVRNVGETPLRIGEVVEVVGVGESSAAGLVVDVVRASADSGRPPLGSVDGRFETVGGESPHGHTLSEAVPAGEVGVAVTHGLFARVRVDGSCGEVRANDPLGVSAVPGIACLHDGSGPLVGYALDEWSVSQKGLIRAYLAPSPGLPAVPPPLVLATRVVDGSPGATTSVASVVEGAAPRVAPRPATVDDRAPADLVSTTESGGGGVPLTLAPAPAAPVAPTTVLPPQPVVAEDPVEDGATAGSTEPPIADHVTPVVPLLPGDTALGDSTGTAGGGDGRGLRGGGVGLHAPGDSNGEMHTPPSPDTPVGGDFVPPQGGGHLYGLENGTAHGVDDPGDDADAPAVDQLWGDVDGDGLLDVLLRDADGIALERNLGQGLFEDVTELSGLAAHGAAIDRVVSWIDAEGDGRLDLLAVGTDGALRYFRGRGQGVFDDAATVAGLAEVEGVLTVEVFDVDGDDAPDLRVAIDGGGVLLLLNDGGGRFATVVLRAATFEREAQSVGTDVDPADG